LAKSTVKNYEGMSKALLNYEDYNKSIYQWNDHSKRFYLDFIKWHEDKGCSKNYTGMHIKDLERIMRTALEEWEHGNDEFWKRYFSVPEDNKKKI